jgi:single-strand DNA-binding protein
LIGRSSPWQGCVLAAILCSDHREAKEDFVNSVSLTGTVATDPELDSLGDGRRLCSFRLAVVRPWGAGACFIRIVASGRQANGCAGVVRAGHRIAVDGRLRSRTWNAGGERRTSVEVVAESVSLLSATEAAAPNIGRSSGALNPPTSEGARLAQHPVASSGTAELSQPDRNVAAATARPDVRTAGLTSGTRARRLTAARAQRRIRGE